MIDRGDKIAPRKVVVMDARGLLDKLSVYGAEEATDQYIREAAEKLSLDDLAEHATNEVEPLALRVALAKVLAIRAATHPDDAGTALLILSRMASSKSTAVRVATADALSGVPELGYQARNILEQLLKDKQRPVQRAAAEALDIA